MAAVKEERDDAVEDQQEEGQNYALFIDRLQQKMDALKKLCSSRGIEQHAVDAALNGEN